MSSVGSDHVKLVNGRTPDIEAQTPKEKVSSRSVANVQKFKKQRAWRKRERDREMQNMEGKTNRGFNGAQTFTASNEWDS